MTKAKMRKAHLGEHNHFYGKRHTIETKLAISRNRTGKCIGPDNPIFGTHRPLETRQRVSATRVTLGIAKGPKNPNWRGGITRGRKAEMQTTAYKLWRKTVFERDNFTCQNKNCGKRGGYLQADHIKPWAFFPELRYTVSNGRTLCLRCHRLTFKELKKWTCTITQ